MKRLLTMFLTVLMVLTAMPTAVSAAETVNFKVSADKSIVNPGDTVTFAVSIGAVTNLGGISVRLKVPAGLTIIENSIVIPDGLAEILDSDGKIAPPSAKNNYLWDYSAADVGYTGSSELTLVTFSCSVNTDAAFGEKDVTVDVEACNENALDENSRPIKLNSTVQPAKLTVEKKKVPVTGVTLDKTSLTLKDGATAKLTATVTPDSADNKTVTWSSDNKAVATVADGVVTAVKAGTAKITVTTQDGNKTASCTVTVTCAHAMVKTDAVAPTCGKDGNIEYYTCSKCGQKYADAAGTKPITDVKVPATGKHGDTEVRDAVAATEDKEGYTGDVYCKVCGNMIEKGKVIAKLPHTHAMKKTDAIAPTCVKDGNIEYYTCTKCGKIYADAAGTREVTNVVVKATGHKTGSAWKSDENEHWKICTVCNSVVDKAEHDYKWVVDKPATEDETGLGHEECVCGMKRSEDTVIPKLDHVHTGIKHHAAVAATCINTGNKEYWTCASAKCAGKYYGDDACQIEISDIILPINPKNHVKDGEWKMDDKTHSRTCVCGEIVDEGAHVYDNDADATCNMCNYKRFYSVVSGANVVYDKNKDKELTIKADGNYKDFDSIKIDGAVVAKDKYSVKEGSTIITLNADYLNTLSDGAHSIEILYKDGKSATTKFTVEKNTGSTNTGNKNNGTTNPPKTDAPKENATTTSPKTDEINRQMGAVGLLAVVAIGAAGAVVYRKRKRLSN